MPRDNNNRLPFSHHARACFLAAALLLGVGAPARATDFETVEGRLIAQLLTSPPAIAVIQGYQTSMLTSGLWSDISYTDHSQTNWAPVNHLSRLFAMAQGYVKTGTILYHDTTLKAAILKGYDAWFAINPYPSSTNWWFQDIGAAQAIGKIMVLMKADLSAAQITKGAAKITANPDAVTGLNTVDEATAKISKGIVQGNSTTVSQGFASIGSVVKLTTGDGIQRDGSFLQHGPQLYNYGYGSGYISSVLSYSVLAAGTSYQITPAQHKILADYLLEGSQQMVRGEAFDYTAFGRGVSRNSPSSAGNSLITPATNAIALGTYRADELATLVTRQTNSRTNHTASPALALTGHRHFWRSDFSTHQRPAYYSSVKISSTRTSQPESGNGEGLKNLYLGDGVNQIMRSGNEYDDIMPVWDWRRLPGTTVEQNSVSLKPAVDWGVKGTATYAGGVSDGVYGATAFQYNRGNVSAKKSWFHFDNEFVALGAVIHAAAATAPVFSTLNQCLLNGAITYSTAATTATLALESAVTPAGLKWVHHDGIGYFFPTPVSNATIKAAAQSGTWLSLNTGGSGTTISKNVFSLYLTQAAGVTGGSYDYLVVPGIAVEEMDAYLATNPVRTLRNVSNVQAAENTVSGITQAAFYAADSIAIEPGRTLAANDKVAVQLRRMPDALEVSAASPEARTMTPQFTFTGASLSGDASPTWFDALGSAISTIALSGSTEWGGSTVGYRIGTDDAATPTISLANTLGSGAISHTVTAPVILPGDTTLEVNTGTTLGFQKILSGAASVTKTGTGTLTLSGANQYSGGTTITSGTAQVSGDQSAAGGGWLIGGNLTTTAATASFLSGSAITIDDGQTFQLNQSASNPGAASLTVAGSMVGNGSLSISRNSTVVLNSGAAWTQRGTTTIGPPSYTGYGSSLTVNSGAIFTYAGATSMIVRPSASGGGTTNIHVPGGTLATAAGMDNPVASSSGSANLILTAGGTIKLAADVPNLVATAGSTFTVQLGTGGGIFHSNGFSTTLALPVTGVGSLTKNGAGTLTLTAANTYAGATIISNGTLRIGNGGTTGTVGVGAVTNHATLEIQRSNAYTLANVIAGSGRFIQAGSGTTTLTGANSWTGETRVEAGGLVIAAAYLPDSASVEIADGALLTLNFSGTDSIGSLTFDEVAQSGGTWGAVGSGADHETTRIAGTGKLQVTMSPDPYIAWIGGFGLPIDKLGKSDDPDGDGISNLLEFALDGNPASGAASGKVVSKIDSGHFTLTLPVRAGAIFTGTGPRLSSPIENLIYQIDGSTNLTNFTAGVEEITTLSTALPPLTSSAWTYRTFRLTTAISAAPKAFLRAGVAEAP